MQHVTVSAMWRRCTTLRQTSRCSSGLSDRTRASTAPSGGAMSARAAAGTRAPGIPGLWQSYSRCRQTHTQMHTQMHTLARASHARTGSCVIAVSRVTWQVPSTVADSLLGAMHWLQCTVPRADALEPVPVQCILNLCVSTLCPWFSALAPRPQVESFVDLLLRRATTFRTQAILLGKGLSVDEAFMLFNVSKTGRMSCSEFFSAM